VAIKDTNGIITNLILTGATMISMLDLQREEEEDQNNTTILLNLMTDTIRTNMVHQEVTTCRHTVSTLTIMVHNKTTQETIKEVVKVTIEVIKATIEAVKAIIEVMKATIEVEKATIEEMIIERV